MTRVTFFLPFLLVTSACGGSGSGTGAAGSGGSAAFGNGGTGATASGGSAGAGVGGASGGSGGSATGGIGGGGPPGSWSFVAEDPSFEWSDGEIATHPTEPASFALSFHSVPYPSPAEATILITKDLGKTSTRVSLMQLPADVGYFSTTGFRYVPKSPDRLLGLLQLPYGLPLEELNQLVVSNDGGKTFEKTLLCDQFSSCPPGNLKSGENWLTIQNNEIWLSTNYGDSFTEIVPPSGCSPSDYELHPSDPTIIAWVCNGIRICSGSSCATSNLPSGAAPGSITFDPANPQHLVARSAGQLWISTDGGQAFVAGASFTTVGVSDLHFDPRPSSNTLYLHDKAQNQILRSTDGGMTLGDVTPPMDLDPNSNVTTYAYAMAVAADGAVIGLSAPGIIRMAP